MQSKLLPRRFDRGGYLTDVYEQMTRMLGLNNWHYGNLTIPRELRNTNYPRELMQETLVLQHVLVAGSVIAKMFDTSEGRGTIRQRLAQEINFRTAQIGTSNSQTGSLVTFAQAKLSPLRREDFAPEDLTKKREGLASGLWAVFFEHANLPEANIGDSQNATSCIKLLSEKTRSTLQPDEDQH